MNRVDSPFLRQAAAFTLLEILIGMTLLSAIFLLLARFTSEVTKTWSKGVSGIERRQNARDFVDFITTDIQFATMPRQTLGTNGTFTVPTAWMAGASAGSAVLTRMPAEQFVINPPGVSATNAQAVFCQSPVATDVSAGNVAEIGYCVNWVATTNGRAVNYTGLLRRLLVNPSSSHYLVQNQTNWISDAVLQSSAPADAQGSYQGRFAEDVYALWVRALDSDGNPIEADATGKKLSGYGFDSRIGYTDTEGVIHPPGSLPAIVEVALVVGDAATSRILTQSYPVTSASASASNFWADVSGYVATLPVPIQNRIHIYSTRIALLNAR